MANVSNKPDIDIINRFTDKLFSLKKLSFLFPLYEDALQEIKSIYRYIGRLEGDNTRLTIELNQEREKREKLQVHAALMQVEMNKNLFVPSAPYFKEVDISQYFVNDDSYYEQFKTAYNHE
jgi:hypothetical protein|tara:strand:+ start:75 stop:437 length:363 start_codon:yes stop_codon:yes gene_type:complete